MDATARHSLWVNWLILASSSVFILVLALAAMFDPSIRLLHFFQAFIYAAVMVLDSRRSAWGYGAGCFVAGFWNWANIAHTAFISNGLRALYRFVQTGQLRRPDQLIAVFAAAAHFVLIGACVAGYLQIRPKTSWHAVKFLLGGAISIFYFAGIIVFFGPQYVPLLRKVVRI